MAQKERRKHLHKLKRHTYRNGEEVYFCTLDCNFRVKTSLAEGLKVICNRCNEPFFMTQRSTELAKPHCDACTKSKKREIDELLNNLEPSMIKVAPEKVEEKHEVSMVNDSRGNKNSINSLRERLMGSIKEAVNDNSDDMV